MSSLAKTFVLVATLLVLWGPDARADRKTVCTITVNSADEREVLRRSLPPNEYQFVELIERGRPDWLAAACRQHVKCDVLVISGHFDGGTEFYTDRLDAREYLPVDEMERVACSDSCPGLFSQLKEVYLFGCNTLNAEPMRSASPEIARSLERAGRAPAEADHQARVLGDRHGESNRDRMRHIFKDVPVIYGFSSKAPLGRSAGPLLERYFQTGSVGEFASGKASAKLLSLFGPSSMTVAAGMNDADPRAGFRRDLCQFADDRIPVVRKVGFLHELLQRDMAEVRMFLDHIERYATSLEVASPRTPDTALALDAIARDLPTRARYLEFVRDADEPMVRARMLQLGRSLGWLSAADERAEIQRMFAERIARGQTGSAEVNLACTLNQDGTLNGELQLDTKTPARVVKASEGAVLACLGSAEGHARVLRALTSASDDDVAIAQVYLRHRPLVDVAELRAATAAIARMDAPAVQVRALHALTRHPVSDRESLDALTRLFPATKSVSVQRAIAGILIRSDYQASERVELARALRKQRLKSPDGEDLIDVLIRRLQAS
jgi:hypothetical protein